MFVFSMRFHLPKRLKKDVSSCDRMANIGALDLVILAQDMSYAGCWPGRFFPKCGRLSALLSPSPLLN